MQTIIVNMFGIQMHHWVLFLTKTPSTIHLGDHYLIFSLVAQRKGKIFLVKTSNNPQYFHVLRGNEL